VHGGIGFTWEHEAHLYFKRAKSTQLLLGRASALRAEVGREAGLLLSGHDVPRRDLPAAVHREVGTGDIGRQRRSQEQAG
jgi:hypothetical protein